MDKSDPEVRVEGIVRAWRYDGAATGKPFALIECTDGTEWVITYDEQSPFHAFADCRVVVFGKPFVPKPWSQHLIDSDGGALRHFMASTLRLVEPRPDAKIL